MQRKVLKIGGLPAAIAGLVMMAVPALAANFALSPVDVTISHHKRSQLIVMTNEDVVPLRYQLSAYRWNESPDGQMALTPTDDVIFFPQIFDLAPHDSQNIRVGAVIPAVDSEKTYRLVLHELKTFEAPGPTSTLQRSAQINVLTNISIPVFVEPPASGAHPGLSALTIKEDTVNFTVTNSGNSHFRIKSMRAEGLSAGAQSVFSKTVQGWYVLGGGSRDYQMALGSGDCRRATHLNLLIETDRGNLQSEAPLSPGACASN